MCKQEALLLLRIYIYVMPTQFGASLLVTVYGRLRYERPRLAHFRINSLPQNQLLSYQRSLYGS